MFLYLGRNTIIPKDKIVAMFDIDGTTVSQKTKDYLRDAEKQGRVINVSQELPRSFVVTEDGTVYISQISVQTLSLRQKNIKYSEH